MNKYFCGNFRGQGARLAGDIPLPSTWRFPASFKAACQIKSKSSLFGSWQIRSNMRTMLLNCAWRLRYLLALDELNFLF
ncbi:hypothetical protein [Desulfovibrio sp.]|uniref:hypothetical protein n=1 Tax=Desulfovibrio sp. TaxID=885 RepID=UPI003D12E97B